MKNINWTRKLTSRKMWTAVASFVSMMIVATGGAENTATQVTALIMAGASVVAYHWRGFDRRRQRGNRSGSDNGRGSVNHGQAGVY